MYSFLNPCESPFHLRSVLLHPLWMEEGHLYPRHVDFSSCSPAESHFSGAAVEEVWRTQQAHSFNSALIKTKIQKKKSKRARGASGAAGLSSCLLVDWSRDARALLPFCPASVYGLESKHRHCPRPYIHSGHLLLYILLYLKPVLNMYFSFGTDRMERMFMYSI